MLHWLLQVLTSVVIDGAAISELPVIRGSIPAYIVRVSRRTPDNQGILTSTVAPLSLLTPSAMTKQPNSERCFWLR